MGAAEQVGAMARLAASTGAEGVVCAVSEATSVKELELDLIGHRASDPPDRNRPTSDGWPPRERRSEQGADLLVVGRPITAATDPIEAAEAVSKEIAAAFRPPPPATLARVSVRRAR